MRSAFGALLALILIGLFLRSEHAPLAVTPSPKTPVSVLPTTTVTSSPPRPETTRARHVDSVKSLEHANTPPADATTPEEHFAQERDWLEREDAEHESLLRRSGHSPEDLDRLRQGEENYLVLLRDWAETPRHQDAERDSQERIQLLQEYLTWSTAILTRPHAGTAEPGE